MSIMYGYNLEEEDDYVHLTYIAATTGHQLLMPGYTLVNVLPFLRYIPTWFPMATSQKMIETTKRITDMLVATPIEIVKNRLVRGFQRYLLIVLIKRG